MRRFRVVPTSVCGDRGDDDAEEGFRAETPADREPVPMDDTPRAAWLETFERRVLVVGSQPRTVKSMPELQRMFESNGFTRNNTVLVFATPPADNADAPYVFPRNNQRTADGYAYSTWQGPPRRRDPGGYHTWAQLIAGLRMKKADIIYMPRDVDATRYTIRVSTKLFLLAKTLKPRGVLFINSSIKPANLQKYTDQVFARGRIFHGRTKNGFYRYALERKDVVEAPTVKVARVTFRT